MTRTDGESGIRLGYIYTFFLLYTHILIAAGSCPKFIKDISYWRRVKCSVPGYCEDTGAPAGSQD